MNLLVFTAYSQTQIDNSPIYFNGGNVGIGTSNPISRLDVSTGGNCLLNVSGGQAGYINAGIVLRANYSTNYRGLGVFMYDAKGGNEWFVGRPYAGSDQFVIYRNDNLSDHADWSAATKFGNGQPTNVGAFFKINSSGNVGIGTTNLSPDYKLSVNGKIRAKEIQVETDWADFVFEDDYQLRSLSEVNNFIKENKHLPDIPSEKQVKEEGISVGEMNAKLLQKIEELTLYLIDQNKKIEDLQKEVSQLKSLNP